MNATIQKYGSNQRVITGFHNEQTVIILVSYRVVVAVKYADGTALRTSCNWSATTNRHIRKFIEQSTYTVVPQHKIDEIAYDVYGRATID